MLAIEALRRYTPGCAGARLRNFGMTIGIRDTRKIDAVYTMTEADVRNEARFADTIGIYPEFIDGYGVLILPTTGRYMHIPYPGAAAARGREPARGGARHRRRPRSPMPRPATWPAAPSRVRAPASPRHSRFATIRTCAASISMPSRRNWFARASGSCDDGGRACSRWRAVTSSVSRHAR